MPLAWGPLIFFSLPDPLKDPIRGFLHILAALFSASLNQLALFEGDKADERSTHHDSIQQLLGVGVNQERRKGQ